MPLGAAQVNDAFELAESSVSQDIMDNRHRKMVDHMVDHIQRILRSSQAAKFAVGYLFLSGLEAVPTNWQVCVSCAC